MRTTPLLLSGYVAAVAGASSSIKFSNSGSNTRISYQNNQLSVGDAGVCVKIDGLAG